MAKVKIQGHASGTGVITVTAPNTSTDRTITLPDTTGTLLDENSSVPAANLTGTVADARFPATLPAASAANLTAIPAANITGTLPAISGASLTGISGGKVLQVLEVNTGSELMVSSTYNSTGGYVTITPSATTSKILVIANSPRVYNNATERVEAAIYRGTSGEGSGSSLNQARIENGGASGNSFSTGTIMWLDEPASTSALTYTVMHRNANNSTLVGWCDGGGGFTPSLMVMEIGA